MTVTKTFTNCKFGDLRVGDVFSVKSLDAFSQLDTTNMLVHCGDEVMLLNFETNSICICDVDKCQEVIKYDAELKLSLS